MLLLVLLLVVPVVLQVVGLLLVVHAESTVQAASTGRKGV